jgi:transposase-like protein
MRRYTITQFQSDYPDDRSCLAYLFKARWPQGVTCATCEQTTKHFPRSKQRAYSCMICGTLVFPTAGTIFHKSPTPLRLWFYAMYLMAQTRCGISAKQLERELGVTYKTAWRMFKQIRMLMEEDARDLHGPVEMDETYIGGRRRGTRGRGADGKVIAAGIVERKGRVTARVTSDVKARTLLPLLWKRVKPYEQQMVYTDELASYNLLPKLGYRHETVRHSANVYVSGDAHTNTIEGFWALVKNGIRGVYHAVGPDYLQSYLNEYSFRYNHRRDLAPMFEVLLGRVPVAAERPAGVAVETPSA